MNFFLTSKTLPSHALRSEAFSDLSCASITRSSVKPAHLQGVLYPFPLLSTPACSLRQGEDAARPSRALCTGCPCRGAAGEAPVSSSSGPSTATAEPGNDAGTTSVRAHLRKRKMPSQVFLHVISCPLGLLLAVLVLGKVMLENH